MRRVLVLVVVAAAIAVGAGLAVPSSAITVNSSSLSHAELNAELTAIDASPSYQCFLQAKAFEDMIVPPTAVVGVSNQAWSTPLAVEWSNSRVNDLAIVGYVEAHDPSAFTTNANARDDLATSIGDIVLSANEQYGQSGFTCGASAQGDTPLQVGEGVLGTMPTWFVNEQVQANTAELALADLGPSPAPESGAALETWFGEHAATFDTVCVSYIVFADPTKAESVAQQIRSGALSFADAAKAYSKDTSTASKGGVIGCFPPSSPSWDTIVHYVGGVPTGKLSPVYTFPSQTAGQAPAYLLFLPTKRTVNHFESIKGAVAAYAMKVNQASALLLAEGIQRSASVSVSSTLGTWQVSNLGSSIVAPTTPPPSSVYNPSANAPAPAT